jgi:hypothetical protein
MAGSAIRGSRVGAGPMGEAERGEAIARFRVSYWCANGHETLLKMARSRFLMNGIALVVVTQLDAIKISRRCQLRTSRTRLTWHMLRSAVPKPKRPKFLAMR